MKKIKKEKEEEDVGEKLMISSIKKKVGSHGYH